MRAHHHRQAWSLGAEASWGTWRGGEGRFWTFWAWLVDFLTKALRGEGCVCFLSVYLSQYFFFISLPATRWSAMTGDGDGKQITEKERLSAAAGKINFWWERKFEGKKCEKEWLPVHRLRECRHRSSGHDGAEYCDGMRPRSCQHSQGRTDSRSDRQADRQKERADGSVRKRSRKGWKDRQRVWRTEMGDIEVQSKLF